MSELLRRAEQTQRNLEFIAWRQAQFSAYLQKSREEFDERWKRDAERWASTEQGIRTLLEKAQKRAESKRAAREAMARAAYIHGTDSEEQARLALLNKLTNEAFLSFLKPEGAGSVLEVGSGLGILAAEAARRAPAASVCGVEYSEEQLSRARQHSLPNLSFIRADAHALPFAGESFDAVYCRYVLEHVGDPLRVLKEMWRVLRVGGRAFAQENNILVIVFDPPRPRFEAVWRGVAELQKRLGGDALIGKRLFSLFRRAGFREVELSLQPEIHHAGQPTFRPWVENLTGNVEGCAEELRASGLATGQEIAGAVAELSEFAGRDDASTIFYWNRASGVKSHSTGE